MKDIASKAELLFMINDLKERGYFDIAVRLQKIFLKSIKNDRYIGKFNFEMKLDRKAKKALNNAREALTKIQVDTMDANTSTADFNPNETSSRSRKPKLIVAV